MAETQDSKAIVPFEGGKLDKGSQRLAVRRGEALTDEAVPHLGMEQIRALIAAVSGYKAERDRLLIQTLFDGCLRCSEALAIRPMDLLLTPTGWQVDIWGKGSRWGQIAISPSLAAQLQAYAYRNGVAPDELLFPITRKRVYQIVQEAFERAGIPKPAHVGAVHVLRHSGAIERLRQTGNPKALQDQLRHKSARMTLRYLKTLSAKESLEIQKGVDLRW